MGFKLLIYQKNVIHTYLCFIKENLDLIRKIYEETEKQTDPYNPEERLKFFYSKAKFLQIMTLIGLTAEHLVKIILLKRGFVLNFGKFK